VKGNKCWPISNYNLGVNILHPYFVWIMFPMLGSIIKKKILNSLVLDIRGFKICDL
jgi:hypothetical protein